MHYQRVSKTGTTDDPRLTIEERFWSKVRHGEPDDCWTWTGSLSRGYGWFFDSRDATAPGSHGIGAHRWLYERWMGPVEPGLHLDHICHDPAVCHGGESCPHRACVNPRHLVPTTHGDNVRRGVRFKPRTHCKRGHEFTPENTAVSPTTGIRRCRTCARDAMRRRRAAMREQSRE